LPPETRIELAIGPPPTVRVNAGLDTDPIFAVTFAVPFLLPVTIPLKSINAPPVIFCIDHVIAGVGMI
jgi:hypothetical protein